MATDGVRLDLDISQLDLPEGFALPDWSAPFDEAAALAAVPDDATVKGMFYSSTLDDLRQRGFEPPREDRYFAFKDYPMRDSVALLIECAKISYAEHSLREGLRRLARPAFPTFADTMVGRAVFGVIGRNPARIYKLAAKAWKHGTSRGKLEPEILDDHTALIRATDSYLPEAVSVGIAEGVLEACGRDGIVAVRPDGPAALQLWAHWS